MDWQYPVWIPGRMGCTCGSASYGRYGDKVLCWEWYVNKSVDRESLYGRVSGDDESILYIVIEQIPKTAQEKLF